MMAELTSCNISAFFLNWLGWWETGISSDYVMYIQVWRTDVQQKQHLSTALLEVDSVPVTLLYSVATDLDLAL